jgi:hypothetical protein
MAGVVRYLDVRALLAARDMAAERRRAAALDCRHHLELAEADMADIGPAPCRAVVAEDVRDLQRWTQHEELRSGRRLGLRQRDAVEWAHDLPDGLGGDACVERRGIELGVAEQHLDHPDIDVLLE